MTVRAFPIRVAPRPGEALDSWLECLAHRLQIRVLDLVTVVAPEPDGGIRRADRQPARWTRYLDADSAARLTAVTGVSAADLENMTLARYRGTAVRVDPAGRTVTQTPLWGRESDSRFCPDCLARSNGRWELWWRLCWAFACPVHHLVLAEVCPSCRRPPRDRVPLSSTGRRPGHCARSGADDSRTAARCGAALADAPVLRLPVGHPTLVAQQLLLDAISAGTATFGVYAADPQPTATALADVRALARRLLAGSTAEELASVLPRDVLTASTTSTSAGSPSHAGSTVSPRLLAPAQAVVAHAVAAHAAVAQVATTAAGFTAAVAVLGLRDVGAAALALRALIDPTRARGGTVGGYTMGRWGRDTSRVLDAVQLAALDPHLTPSDRLRHRTSTLAPQRPDHDSSRAARRARCLPTLLWPEWSLRLAVDGLRQQRHRRALSCSVMLIGTGLQLSQAVEILGSSPTDLGLSPVLGHLAAHPHWRDVCLALTRIADYLDEHGAPIDYDRRRALNYSTLLPDDAWRRLCRRAGRVFRWRDVTLARAVLFERLSGLPSDQAPDAAGSESVKADVADFFRYCSAEVAAGLDAAARAFLREQDIDEPVAWCPPLSLLGGLTLPGADPDAIDTTAVHRLLRRRPEVPTPLVAEELGTSVDALRWVFEHHPRPDSRANRFAIARVAAVLPENELVRLYCDEGLSLKVIADRVGVSWHLIGRLARDYGIEIRASGPGTQKTVDREWFLEQYVQNRRTLRDIGEEVGLSHRQMQRRAQEYGIPLRAAGGVGRRQRLHHGDRLDVVGRDWLHQEYVVGRRTMADIAAEVGVTHRTVCNWLRAHAIPARGPGAPSQHRNLTRHPH